MKDSISRLFSMIQRVPRELNLLATMAAVPLVLGLVPTFLFGQAVNGSMVGTITDRSGGLVPGAQVKITEEGTDVTRTVETDASGYYSFADVKPSTYRVAVEKQGFKTAVRSGVEVPVNATVRVDLGLEVGQVSQEVNVTGTVPLLQTDILSAA